MMENSTSPFQNFDELKISGQAKELLKEAAKWANFISIMGYIGIGFMVLMSLFFLIFGASSSLSTSEILPFGSAVFVVVIYLIIAALYFFPVYYLNKFASSSRQALRSNNTVKLTEAIDYLKSHYKFIAIMIIVTLSLYILFFFVAMMGAISGI